MNRNQFPECFTSKGRIITTVKPLKFGQRTYYQATVASEGEPEYNSKPYLKPYMENDDEMLDCGDIEDSYEIVLTKSGNFFTSFYVPSSVLPFVIGAKGAKLKALQRNTNTVIKIPRVNEKGEVMITGDTERKVASARTQISMIVAQRRDRMRPTHFVGVPIKSDTIKANLLKFRDEIMINPPNGVTNNLFQDSVKLHLTVLVLKILDTEELNIAKKTLQNCYDEVISDIFLKNNNYNITIKGLDIMNDDPYNVRVLYGKVQMENNILMDKLNRAVDALVSYFCKTGIAKKEYEKVKLHMTIMNTSFLESELKTSFDASDILRKYGEFYFGTFELNQIDLCIRGTTTTDTGEKKYYDTAFTISI